MERKDFQRSTYMEPLGCWPHQRKMDQRVSSNKANGRYPVSSPNLTRHRSPDGTSLLVSTEDNALSVYILYLLPLCERLITSPPDILEQSTSPRILSPYAQVRECASAKSSIWYSGMNLQFPETCCFLSATNDQPIHLWDALNARVPSIFFNC